VELMKLLQMLLIYKQLG